MGNQTGDLRGRENGDVTGPYCPPTNEVLPEVYRELHALAEVLMSQERPGHTLQPTALIHEAYLRLAEQDAGQWKSRAHFVAVAAQAMRRVLVDSARRRRRAKRGGAEDCLPWEESLFIPPDRGPDLLALDEALDRLAQISPDHERLVVMRFFGGLTIQDAADVLEVSSRTADRMWRCARAWLYRFISGSDTGSSQMEQP